MLFHEANSRQNLSGWHKGEIWPKSLWLTPTNVDNISQKSHAAPKTRNLAQGFWPFLAEKWVQGLPHYFSCFVERGCDTCPLGRPPPGSATIRPILGHVSAFGKLAIKQDPNLGIDFRLLRRLTPAHIYNAGQKSPPAPKTRNLGKIRGAI